MQKFVALSQCILFEGLDENQIENALNCLGAKEKKYPKNSAVFFEGDKATHFGIVVEGILELRKTDFFGNSNLVAVLSPPDMFAEAAAFSLSQKVPFDVVCRAESRVLYFLPQTLFDGAGDKYGLKNIVLKNLLRILSDKNVQLTGKIDILTKRTIREKVLAFLMAESIKQGSRNFRVAYTRQQMADFLSVDRSALSRELCHMRDEGVLEFAGNKFRLKK